MGPEVEAAALTECLGLQQLHRATPLPASNGKGPRGLGQELLPGMQCRVEGNLPTAGSGSWGKTEGTCPLGNLLLCNLAPALLTLFHVYPPRVEARGQGLLSGLLYSPIPLPSMIHNYSLRYPHDSSCFR